MSTKVLGPVWRLQLPPTEKFVMVSLADQANDDGLCWPSVGTLVERTGYGERTVQEALRQLAQRGLIERVVRPGSSTVYQLNLAALPQLDLFVEARRRARLPSVYKQRGAATAPLQPANPRSSGTTEAQQAHPGGAPAAPRTSREPSVKHLEPQHAAGRQSAVQQAVLEDQVRTLMRLMGNPTALQRAADETLEAWQERVRAAWQAEQTQQRTTHGGRHGTSKR
jgi:DNA-binding transcriptional MocR family regulator